MSVIAVVALVAVIVGGILGWRQYSAHREEAKTQAVEASVKESMQIGFNTKPKLAGYSVTVKDVSLAHKVGNEYVGSAELSSYKLEGDRRVRLTVVDDGSTQQWTIEPGDLDSLARDLVEAP